MRLNEVMGASTEGLGSGDECTGAVAWFLILGFGCQYGNLNTETPLLMILKPDTCNLFTITAYYSFHLDPRLSGAVKTTQQRNIQTGDVVRRRGG